MTAVKSWVHYLINDYAYRRREMLDLYGRYIVHKEDVPIFTRVVPDYNKINNTINNDFFSEIIDTKVGYMLGNPIVYSLNPDQADKSLRTRYVGGRSYTTQNHSSRIYDRCPSRTSRQLEGPHLPSNPGAQPENSYSAVISPQSDFAGID